MRCEAGEALFNIGFGKESACLGYSEEVVLPRVLCQVLVEEHICAGQHESVHESTICRALEEFGIFNNVSLYT
jgi:hypothetical protein